MNFVAPGGEMLGEKRFATTETDYYYLKDHLGSIRIKLKQDGTVVAENDFYPYGKLLRQVETGAENRYKFTGKERDAETAGNGVAGVDYFGARVYDAEVGVFHSVDFFADKYPSLTPYHYAANNPTFFVDVNGDSLINVRIVNTEGFIHGDNPITIDHTYLNDLTKILQSAVANRVHIHINSSFRTIKQQNSDEIQKKGTNPAGSGSRHVAGFAFDFNLYEKNDVSKGLLKQNRGQNRENNKFLQAIVDHGSRWGGEFDDPIHFDAGDNSTLSKRYGVDFAATRIANQTQYANRGIRRTVRRFFNLPLASFILPQMRFLPIQLR